MQWNTALAVFDWLARLQFAGALLSGGLSAVTGLAAYLDGWDALGVFIAMMVVFASVALIYIAFCSYWDRMSVNQHVSPRPNINPTVGLPSDIADAIPDLRVAESDLVLAILANKESDKLLPLLEGEKLRSWARPMHGNDPGKDPPPVILKGDIWRTHYIQFFPKAEGRFRAQTFLKTKARHESSYFDVLLNKAQIEQIWSDQISLIEAARHLYEAAEAAHLLDFFVLKTDSPEEKLSHLKMLLMIDERVEILGAKPPSTQVRSIPKAELIDELYPAKGSANEIVGLMSEEPVFVDVKVRRATLIQFIEVSIAEAKSNTK